MPDPAVHQALARGRRGPWAGHGRATGANLTGRDTGTKVACGPSKTGDWLIWCGPPIFPVAASLRPHPVLSLVLPAQRVREGRGAGADPLGSVTWALSQP